MSKALTIKRTFDAPRELVFKAWTEPKLVSQWWGPQMFTVPACKIEPRQGGSLYIVMHGPKGSDFDVDMPMRGVFTEYEPPRRLVFTNEALFDDKGDPQLATICTVTFTEVGSKTDMLLQIELTKVTPTAEAAWAGAEMGWNQSLDKLASFIAARAADGRLKKTSIAA